ncbi:hypothetical protein KFU94_60675 [Chloroflexi bacterium TSY]|nr:hypothetical protein [Chloroflexi bacterium TSY]
MPVDMELLVFEQVGEHRALVMREMAYHHVAQGKVANKYLVSFDLYATAGWSNPTILDRFIILGWLANGLSVMADEETRTLWDHITVKPLRVH